MGDLLYQLLCRLLRLLIKKPQLTGEKNVIAGQPAVFIANHLGHFAPLLLFLYAPFPYTPWVRREIIDPRLCRDYLEADFTTVALRLKPPLSRWLSALISLFCVPLMRYLRAIPVNPPGAGLRQTLDQSLAVLESHGSLLIFPEIPGPDRQTLGEFYNGFVYLAKEYYELHQQAVYFYPLAVNRQTNQVSCGPPVCFNADNPYREEKNRICAYLHRSIADLLSGIDEEPPQQERQ